MSDVINGDKHVQKPYYKNSLSVYNKAKNCCASEILSLNKHILLMVQNNCQRYFFKINTA